MKTFILIAILVGGDGELKLYELGNFATLSQCEEAAHGWVANRASWICHERTQ